MNNCWAILTGEYPPQPGGVSDYTRLVAVELANAGDEVHVWAPALRDDEKEHADQADPRVVVRRIPDHFGPAGLRMLEKGLGQLAPGHRLLVQYVPHAYGFKAMNLRFCLWLWSRRRGQIWTMFHEVAFPWVRTPLKHNLLATVNRLMALFVTRASKKVFISTPAWKRLLLPFMAPGNHLIWMPVPSNIPTSVNPTEVAALRETLTTPGRQIFGYFGSFMGPILSQLLAILPRILAANENCVGLLLGRGGDAFVTDFADRFPEYRSRILAPGYMEPASVAKYLSACDLLILPYPDGASSRRSSLMAALALGIPTLTTTGPSTESFWRDDETVALVPAGDSEAFAATAKKLLANPITLKTLAEHGARLYREKFSIDRTVETLRAAARRTERSA